MRGRELAGPPSDDLTFPSLIHPA